MLTIVARHPLAEELGRDENWLAHQALRPIPLGAWRVVGSSRDGRAFWYPPGKTRTENMAWRYWRFRLRVASPTLLVRAIERPAGPVGARQAQPSLFPQLEPACSCGRPLPRYIGRPGRPRTHCEVCAPPAWPLVGEPWVIEGQSAVVIGSGIHRDVPGHKVIGADPKRPCSARTIRFRLTDGSASEVRVASLAIWRSLATRAVAMPSWGA
jgi:hypothetical protein